MQTLKVDITKLKTVRNYSKIVDKTVDWIYKLARKKEIETIKIDGVIFVKIS